MSIPLLLAGLLACGGSEPADLSKTPDGRLCQRALSSTIDSLTDMFNSAGKPLPEWPSKEAYVEKCVGLGFDEAQLKCLDPKLSQADPAGCKETLDPVRDKQKQLSDWFAGEIGGKPAKPKEGKAKGGKAEGGE